MMRRWVTALAAVLAAAGTIGAEPANTGAAPEVLSARDMLAGPNVVYNDSSPALEDSVLQLVLGESDASGTCTFTFEGRIEPGEEREYVERAFDLDTCKAVYESGSSTNRTEPWAILGEAEGSAEINSAESVTSVASSGTRAAAVHRNAGVWSWYDDPPRWVRGCDVEDACIPDPVSQVENDVSWWPDGTCTLVAGQVANLHTYLNHLGLTGWKRNDFTWNRTQVLPPSPCSTPIFSETTAHFENRLFCAGVVAPVQALFPTKNNYEPNGVQVFGDGGAWFTHVLSKSGLCGTLLMDHFKVWIKRI